MNQVLWLAGHHPRGTFFNLFPPGCELLLALHKFTHLSTVNHCNIMWYLWFFAKWGFYRSPIHGKPIGRECPRCHEDCNKCEDAAVFSCLDATLCCQVQRRAKAPNLSKFCLCVCKYTYWTCTKPHDMYNDVIVFHQWPIDLAALQNADACSECKNSKFLNPDLWCETDCPTG